MLGSKSAWGNVLSGEKIFKETALISIVEFPLFWGNYVIIGKWRIPINLARSYKIYEKRLCTPSMYTDKFVFRNA